MNLFDLAIRSAAVVIGFLHFGAVGVAAGRLVAAAIMAGLYLREVGVLISADLASQLTNLWKIAAAGAVMAGGVLALRSSLASLSLPALAELVIVAGSGAPLYAASLLACGVWLTVGAGRLEITDRWWRR